MTEVVGFADDAGAGVILEFFPTPVLHLYAGRAMHSPDGLMDGEVEGGILTWAHGPGISPGTYWV